MSRTDKDRPYRIRAADHLSEGYDVLREGFLAHWVEHYYVTSNPPKSWIDTNDNNVARRRVRDVLGELVKEYRGEGSIENDDEVPDRRIRLPYWD